MNAPQRHHRHREEPKARPLRVGDTEKPGPEGEWKFSFCRINGFKTWCIQKHSVPYSAWLFCTPQHHLHPIIASGQTTKKPPMTTIMRSSRRWIEDIEEQFLFSEDDIKFSVLFCKKNCSWLPVVNGNIKFQCVRRDLLNSVARTFLSLLFWIFKLLTFKNRCY